MTPTDPRVERLMELAHQLRWATTEGDTTRAAEAIRAALSEALGDSQPVAPKIAPVQGWPMGIPWELHLEAYAAYSKKWAPQPAMIEGGCRGGFSTGELDDFIPGWRDRALGITALHEEIARLRAELASPQRAEPASVQAPDVDSRFQEAMSAADQSARSCIDDGKRNYIIQTARNAWNKSRPEAAIVREPLAEIERHARRIHELMCQANLIGGMAATCSFNGWTADGRAVRHTIKTDGYERTGPKVEKERAALAAHPSTDQNHSG